MSTHDHLEGDCSIGGRSDKVEGRESRFFRKISGPRPGLAAVLMLAAWCRLSALVFAQPVEESQLQAAYLYNFAKFVDWPAGTFRSPDDPMVICVLGDDRTGDVLEQSVSGKRANGRPVQSRHPHSPEECKPCHILFIGSPDKNQITEILQVLQGSRVLTVGHSAQFIPLGGIINLARKEVTIELEIDPEAADAAGLKISSRLLVIARLVKRKEGGMR